ncbi:MAG: flagellar hook-basal body complex protein, partial [Candidatus Gastranaerophilales bacterium]|nr:flagellar hook-basal body complex protein [Candidatus Gastranaerophilales bacterium]
MSQGLFTAASGIAANQASLNVIADNIANINTVAFKSSQINFETLFAQQLSAGSAPSNERGGINPMEIGLGCTISEVGRNFSNGSVMTTGRSTDLCIQGDGFFTVQNSVNQTFLTRAGNFSMDASGYLVTPSGYYVIGTDSSAGGGTRVQVPLKLNFVTPNAAGTDVIANIGQESGSAVTNGTFSIRVTNAAGAFEDVTATIDPTDTLAQVAAKMQTAIHNSTIDDGSTTVTVGTNADGDAVLNVDTTADRLSFSGQSTDTSNFLSVMGFASQAVTVGTVDFTVAGDAGTIDIEEGDTLSDIAAKLQVALRDPNDDGTDEHAAITVTVNNGQLNIDTTTGSEDVVLANTGSSNAYDISNLQGAAATGFTVTFDSESAPLKNQSQVTIANPDNSSATASITTYSIGNDGAIDVTYSNGAKLTVTTNDATKELKYTSANGRVITGVNNIENLSSVVPAQLQLQLATVINPKGLNVVGGNLFSLNSAAGEATYATPGTGGLGIVKSGSLEASNVDLPSEFSNMILAQRAIEASSRT